MILKKNGGFCVGQMPWTSHVTTRPKKHASDASVTRCRGLDQQAPPPVCSWWQKVIRTTYLWYSHLLHAVFFLFFFLFLIFLAGSSRQHARGKNDCLLLLETAVLLLFHYFSRFILLQSVCARAAWLQYFMTEAAQPRTYLEYTWSWHLVLYIHRFKTGLGRSYTLVATYISDVHPQPKRQYQQAFTLASPSSEPKCWYTFLRAELFYGLLRLVPTYPRPKGNLVKYVCESYTCCCRIRRVRLRGIPGATATTRTTTPRESPSPCSMSTSEGQASKKAKTVENESGASKYCTSTGTSVRVARAAFFTPSCCCTTQTTSFQYNLAWMSTDSLMGKSLGSGISTYYLMGKYLRYSRYVLFAFTCHIPAPYYWLFYH